MLAFLFSHIRVNSVHSARAQTAHHNLAPKLIMYLIGIELEFIKADHATLICFEASGTALDELRSEKYKHSICLALTEFYNLSSNE